MEVLDNMTGMHSPLKNGLIRFGLFAALALTWPDSLARAQARPAAPHTNAPARSAQELRSSQFRRELKALPPEKRQARVKAYLEERRREAAQRRTQAAQRRLEWRRLQQQLQHLSPQERQARLREWRRRHADQVLHGRALSPAERLAKRRQMRARLGRLIDNLHRKQAQGTLTPEEARRLKRMEEIARRFDRIQARLARQHTNAGRATTNAPVRKISGERVAKPAASAVSKAPDHASKTIQSNTPSHPRTP